MSTETQQLEVAERPSKSPISIGASGLVLQDLDGLWRFSNYVAKSGFAPKGIQSPEGIFIAIQMGMEVGLTPMAALQNIAVINGRPSIWGDAQLAIVRGTGQLEILEEWFEAGGKRLPRNPITYTDDTTAICRVKRRGYEPNEVGFSVADAKTAGLWNKEGPWRQYPFRMLKFRARSFALRDQFGDALKGIMSAEESRDTPPEVIVSSPSIAATVAASATTRERKARVIEAETATFPSGVPVNPEPAGETGNVGGPGAVGVRPAERSLQDRLADLVIGEGCTFDHFTTTAKELSMLDGEDINATSFDELSSDLCKRCLAAHRGLKTALKVAKEGGAK